MKEKYSQGNFKPPSIDLIHVHYKFMRNQGQICLENKRSMLEFHYLSNWSLLQNLEFFLEIFIMAPLHEFNWLISPRVEKITPNMHAIWPKTSFSCKLFHVKIAQKSQTLTIILKNCQAEKWLSPQICCPRILTFQTLKLWETELENFLSPQTAI